MSSNAGTSIIQESRSESTPLSWKILPTNASSKAIARPIVLAATFSTAISASTSAASTPTALAEPGIPFVALVEVKTRFPNFEVEPTVVDSITTKVTTTAVILLTTTSTSTEQADVVTSTQTIISQNLAPLKRRYNH